MNLFAIDYNVISLEFQNIFVLFRNNDFYKYLCFPTKTFHTYKITKVEGKYNGLKSLKYILNYQIITSYNQKTISLIEANSYLFLKSTTII